MAQIVQWLPAAFLALWAIPITLDLYGYWKRAKYPKPLVWFMRVIHSMFTAGRNMMVIIPLAIFMDALNTGFPVDPWIAFIAAALICPRVKSILDTYIGAMDFSSKGTPKEEESK